jgi:hypothetical protein
MIQSIKFVRNSLGEGILIGFHIVGTGAAELLSSVTPMPVHPSSTELLYNKTVYDNSVLQINPLG